MPDVPVGAQIFDLVFHPTQSTVYAGLLTGEIQAFKYDEQGQYEKTLALRPSKRSCRGLTISQDGSKLWSVGKAKALHTIDTNSGNVDATHPAAHDAPINRVKHLMPHMLATGDDDGVIKLWDTRRPGPLRAYAHHFDFISDFLWLEDKRQLVATSGDGTLSVIDVRGKKTEPLAQSEDQEDELLSIVPIRGGSKIVVGTQLGILSIFNRSSGWGDCVDRVPGHPHSIDALSPLPAFLPSSDSTILTGSSDGLLRAVQLFPTKLLGVVADHGDFPIECIAVERGGAGCWVGSAGHDEILRLTDLMEVFEIGTGDSDEGEDGEEDEDEDGDGDVGGENSHGEEAEVDGVEAKSTLQTMPTATAETEEDSDKEEAPRQKKRKREKDPLTAGSKKKGRNEMNAELSFFSGL